MLRNNQPIIPESVSDLEYLLESFPGNKEEFFERYVATETNVRLVRNAYCLRRIAGLYPEKKNELFKIFILNGLNSQLVRDTYSLNHIVKAFPNKLEELFDKYIVSIPFDDDLVNTTSNLERIAQLFPDKNARLFAKYIQSIEFDDQLIKSIYDLERIVLLFPDEKERLFTKYVESTQFDDRLIECTYELKHLIKLFPEKKERLFTKYIGSNKLNTILFQQNSLPALLNLFSDESQQDMIINNYLNHHYLRSKRLSPNLFVPPQKGPTCGFNALSAITKYFSSRVKNSSLFFSVKRTDSINGNNGLRKIGRTVGINSCGGIYALKLFRDLITAINLHGEVLHITKEKDFSDIIRSLIDHNIPIILPYDCDKNSGNSAHYAVVMGYAFDKHGKLSLIITHEGMYELYTSELIFSLNADLNYYNANNGLYTKKTKQDEYSSTPPLQLTNHTFYKTYQYPLMNLKNTLKNRILIVLTKDMFDEIQKDVVFFQKIKPFIEQDPQGIEVLVTETPIEQHLKVKC